MKDILSKIELKSLSTREIVLTVNSYFAEDVILLINLPPSHLQQGRTENLINIDEYSGQMCCTVIC